jgi:protein-disulfide isomerase
MDKQKNNLFSLLMLLLILIVLVFLVYTFAWDINVFKTKRDETVIQSQTEKYILSSLPNDPIKGDSASPVSIYLFVDYEVENIVNVLDIMDNLILKHPDDLRLIWKDLPLPKHYFAKGAALAARCALDENKYWEYSEQLLRKERSLSLDLYQSIANNLEMNLDNFLSCYKSGKYLYDIENNVREAYVLDVYDIPTIFINQEKIEGEISFERLDEIINNLIK